MLRGGKCMGYTFGKDGIAEKNKPQKYKKVRPDYKNIDPNTGYKKNFADMHQDNSKSNMFGKKTVDKKTTQFRYQGQYDSGNYTYGHKISQNPKIQYYHKSDNVKNKTFQNKMYPQNTFQYTYSKGYTDYQKNLREYPQKNQPKQIYKLQEPQEIDMDFININRYPNKNTIERDYNIITCEDKQNKQQ